LLRLTARLRLSRDEAGRAQRRECHRRYMLLQHLTSSLKTIAVFLCKADTSAAAGAGTAGVLRAFSALPVLA
jgi:hypothetical protein